MADLIARPRMSPAAAASVFLLARTGLGAASPATTARVSNIGVIRICIPPGTRGCTRRSEHYGAYKSVSSDVGRLSETRKPAEKGDLAYPKKSPRGGRTPHAPLLCHFEPCGSTNLGFRWAGQVASGATSGRSMNAVPMPLAHWEKSIEPFPCAFCRRASARTRFYGGQREFQRVSLACSIMQTFADEALSIAAPAVEYWVTRPVCSRPAARGTAFRLAHSWRGGAWTRCARGSCRKATWARSPRR
ncbi:hypothetical protein Rsw2DRAFT_2799 [Rhodobacter ferrooxidans]|uniref:Uncharacterized protein n=1 Tax=Rhodobacter ferrooxidans TaxID=371731 RepID=C8S421_9RHOB|nr:hypothetical protein Rsw2DRAFT_2799 [Rhodobacter sp. SW2]